MDEQFENDCNKLFYFLPGKLKKAISRMSADVISETSLKEYYFPVLRAIYYKDGITQKEITSYLTFDKSRVSVIVHELIENGFVTDTGQGRTSCLHLTEEGRQANAVGRMYYRIAYGTFFQDFTDEELEQSYRFFAKLDKRLDEILAEKEDKTDS